MLIASSALAGFEVGTALPRPDQLRGGLVQPKKLTLTPVTFADTTRIVIFFYSASWCEPCQKIGAALEHTYSEFRAKAPGIQIVTYSVDDSPRSRADTLRNHAYPWPAMGPTVINQKPWLKKISGGTPQFQAFAVEANKLKAITPPGNVDEVIHAALALLATTP